MLSLTTARMLADEHSRADELERRFSQSTRPKLQAVKPAPKPRLRTDGTHLDSPLARLRDSRPRKYRELSRRSRQIVQLIAAGKPNKEIAFLLGLTEGTVKIYVSQIFTRTGYHSRLELAVAYLNGDLRIDPAVQLELPGVMIMPQAG